MARDFKPGLFQHRGALLVRLAIAATIFLGGTTLKAAPQLRAEFQSLAVTPRTAAPALVNVKLHWQGTRLLEGVLELTVTSRGEPALHQRSQELVLNQGVQVIPV